MSLFTKVSINQIEVKHTIQFRDKEYGKEITMRVLFENVLRTDSMTLAVK